MRLTTACHSLKLPLTFEGDLLSADMLTCIRSDWSRHVNTQDYSGDWTSIALYSLSGNADDTRTEGGAFLPTPLLESCPYILKILSELKCDKEAVRLLRLAPGSIIHEHRDRGLCYERGAFRLHIPLQTSEDVDFVVDNQRMNMRAGECWYANFDLPHSVKNRGELPRVHLVIDCVRNEWSDQLFAEAGYDFECERKVLAPDEATVLAMIAELERINTDTSKVIIADLKKQING